MISLTAMKLVWVLVMFTTQGSTTFGMQGIFNSHSICNQVAEQLTSEIEELEAESGLDIEGFTCFPIGQETGDLQ